MTVGFSPPGDCPKQHDDKEPSCSGITHYGTPAGTPHLQQQLHDLHVPAHSRPVQARVVALQGVQLRDQAVGQAAGESPIPIIALTPMCVDAHAHKQTCVCVHAQSHTLRQAYYHSALLRSAHQVDGARVGPAVQQEAHHV